MTILIVDLARVGVREGFVGFGDLDKFGERGAVFGVFVWVVFLGEGAVGAFDFAVGGGFGEAEEVVVVLCGQGEGYEGCEEEEDGEEEMHNC